MEIIGMGAIGIGFLLTLIGWVLLIVAGFKVGGAVWGILNIFFQPITGIIFCVVHKTGWGGLILLIIGMIIQVGGVVPLMWNTLDKIPQ